MIVITFYFYRVEQGNMRGVRSNVMCVDIVKEGIRPRAPASTTCPPTLSPPCPFTLPSLPINAIATAVSSLQYLHVRRWKAEHWCASTWRAGDRDRGGLCLGWEGSQVLFSMGCWYIYIHREENSISTSTSSMYNWCYMSHLLSWALNVKHSLH